VFRVVERVLTYRKASDQTISFVLGLREHLKSGSMDKAHKAAGTFSESPVAKVVAAGIHAYQTGETAKHSKGPADIGDFDIVDSVNRAVDRVKEREGSTLRKGLAGLGTVATITPFIGLFGTVIGIMTAFQSISDKGNATLDTVGPHIAEALFATAIGLVAAVPAVMAYNYFVRRIRVLRSEMDTFEQDYLNIIKRHFLH